MRNMVEEGRNTEGAKQRGPRTTLQTSKSEKQHAIQTIESEIYSVELCDIHRGAQINLAPT